MGIEEFILPGSISATGAGSKKADTGTDSKTSIRSLARGTMITVDAIYSVVREATEGHDARLGVIHSSPHPNQTESLATSGILTPNLDSEGTLRNLDHQQV